MAERAGDTRSEYEGLFDVYLLIGLTVFLAVLVAVIYVVVPLRSRSGELPRVGVTAFKWSWRFDYPQYGITEAGSPPTLVVPVDTPVRFEQTSSDVIHSFFVPERRFKRDAFPGRTTRFTLRWPRQRFLRQGGYARSSAGSFTRRWCSTCASSGRPPSAAGSRRGAPGPPA